MQESNRTRLYRCLIHNEELVCICSLHHVYPILHSKPLGASLNRGPAFECTVYTTCSLKTHDRSQPALSLLPGRQHFAFPAIRIILQDFTVRTRNSGGMHRRHSSKRCDVV